MANGAHNGGDSRASTGGPQVWKCIGCRTVAVCGGAPNGPQVSAIQKGCELIIGRPSRSKDVIDVGGGGRDSCTSMLRVLDENDRMLDTRFERDICAILWETFGDRAHRTFFIFRDLSRYRDC